MTARALMFQGTGSDVGKSLIVAGLCRAFARRGLRVRPFKPQNMSNNAAVTDDGGEIGRAQALQARACGVPASVHMNPVLLKPQSEIGAQVVVQGKVIGNARAREYQASQTKAHARRAGQLRAYKRGRGSRARRRGGQRSRDQSARGRHREHGICPRRRTVRSCLLATSIVVAFSPRFSGSRRRLRPRTRRRSWASSSTSSAAMRLCSSAA